MDNITSSDIIGDQKLADVKLSSLSLSADALVSTFNSLIDSDNAKLPLSGGTVTGDLSVLGQVKVGQGIRMETGISGENGQGQFCVTNTESQVANYDILGGYIEGTCGIYTKANDKTDYDESTLATKFWFEPQCVGAKVYCILSAWNDATSHLGQLKLSGDVSALKEFLADSAISASRWSLQLYSGNQPGNFRVTSCWTDDTDLSAGCVSLDRELRLDNCGIAKRISEGVYELNTGWDSESAYMQVWDIGVLHGVQNSFYCPTHPTVGNQISPFFMFAHCEGNANRAIFSFDHVEGRKNITDGGISHAEGSENISYGWINHIEGYRNRCYSSHSHVEGFRNIVYAGGAHVEGSENVVGLSSDQCIESNGVMHVAGAANQVVHSTKGMVTGSKNVLSASESDIVTGVQNTLQNANSDIVTGSKNSLVSEGSKHVSNNAVYGQSNMLSGAVADSIVGGYENKVFDSKRVTVDGQSNRVLSCNTAQVGGSYVYATKQDRSFLWSGKTATQYKYPQYYGYAVDSAGNYTNKFPAGSFCVNPQGDTNGFYIGTETLSSIISSAIEAALKSHSLI